MSWLSTGEVFVLPDATHFLQVENPRAMAKVLADFYARHPLSDAPTAGRRTGRQST